MKMRMIWNLFIQVQLVVSLILPVNCWPVLRNLDVSVLLEVKTRAMSSPVLEIKMMLFQMFEFYLQNQTSQNLTFLGGVLASSGGDSQFIGMKNIPGYITLTTRTLFFAFIVQLL